MVGGTQISATSIWIRVDPDGDREAWTRLIEGARVSVEIEDTAEYLVGDLARWSRRYAEKHELPRGLTQLLGRAEVLTPPVEDGIEETGSDD